jgi:cardiolipin synthase
MSELTLFNVLALVSIVLAAVAACHIVLTKEDVRSAVAWTGLVFLSPFVGSIVYVILGVNRIHREASKLKKKKGQTEVFDLFVGGKASETRIEPHVWQMYLLGQKVHPDEFVNGNSVMPLVNGDQAFPAMLDSISKAKRSIALMTYIFDRDKSGLQFVDALSAAKRNGVDIYVLIDDVGIKYGKPPIDKELRQSGISTGRFMPTRALRFWRFVNLRNHRKILLIDGEQAFIGGMNIRHGNVLEESPDHPIQDIHFRVRGPVIDQMNKIFEDDWLFATGQQISLPVWSGANDLHNPGVLARVVPDGPDTDMQKLQWLFLGALACAQRSVRIMTPYFLPDEVMTRALQLAALRGVSVEILLPEKSNLFGFDWAMEPDFKRLLESGVKIYRTPQPFDHSKVLVIDDGWCSVGSCNWDARSFRLNFECNLECVSSDLAHQLNDVFAEKRRAGKLVALDVVQSRSVWARIRNRVARLLSPYL